MEVTDSSAIRPADHAHPFWSPVASRMIENMIDDDLDDATTMLVVAVAEGFAGGRVRPGNEVVVLSSDVDDALDHFGL